MKVTDWFDSVTPARAGVYFVEFKDTDGEIKDGYAKWSGKEWGCVRYDIDAADRFPDYGYGGGIVRWRGLASDPSLDPQWYVMKAD